MIRSEVIIYYLSEYVKKCFAGELSIRLDILAARVYNSIRKEHTDRRLLPTLIV